jgi:hypothetical protein
VHYSKRAVFLAARNIFYISAVFTIAAENIDIFYGLHGPPKIIPYFHRAIKNCTLLSLDHLRPPKIKLLSTIFLHRASNLILERSEIGKFLTPARPAYSRAPEPLTHNRLRSCPPSTARRHRLLPDADAFPPQAGAAAHAWIRSYGSMNGKSSYIIFFINIYTMICY